MRKHDIPLYAGLAAGISVFTTVNTVLKENIEPRGSFHSLRLKTGRLTMASAAGFKVADEVHNLADSALRNHRKRQADKDAASES